MMKDVVQSEVMSKTHRGTRYGLARELSEVLRRQNISEFNVRT